MYFRIGDVDFSKYVNELKISTNHTYNSQTNAAGDTVVDYVGYKRKITVGIIPLSADTITSLLSAIGQFDVYISFLNPTTGAMVTDVHCVIPSNEVEYYTIRSGKTSFKAFKLNFIEL